MGRRLLGFSKKGGRPDTSNRKLENLKEVRKPNKDEELRGEKNAGGKRG